MTKGSNVMRDKFSIPTSILSLNFYDYTSMKLKWGKSLMVASSSFDGMLNSWRNEFTKGSQRKFNLLIIQGVF